MTLFRWLKDLWGIVKGQEIEMSRKRNFDLCESLGVFVPVWKCAHWTCEIASNCSLTIYYNVKVIGLFQIPDAVRLDLTDRVWCYVRYHYFTFKNKEELNGCGNYYEILNSDFKSTRRCNVLKGKFSYHAIIVTLKFNFWRI